LKELFEYGSLFDQLPSLRGSTTIYIGCFGHFDFGRYKYVYRGD